MPYTSPYAELHCHTNFSFLDGTSDPEELVERAEQLGLAALAITDHHGLSGLVRFAVAAKELGVKAIVGAEVALQRREGERARGRGGERFEHHSIAPAPTRPFAPSLHHIVLLARDVQGYRNLCRLLSHAHLNALPGPDPSHPQPCLDWETLAQHSRGLIALSGCQHGELASALHDGGVAAATVVARRYRDLFGPDGYFVELHNHLLQADGPRNAALRQAAGAAGLRCVATNNVHYATPARALLHYVVTCIRHRTTLEAAQAGVGARHASLARAGHAPPLLKPNQEFYLKSPQQMARLFQDDPAALATSLEIAQECRFSLGDLRYQFPRPELPGGAEPYDHLVRLVWEGAVHYYGGENVGARHASPIRDRLGVGARHASPIRDRLVHELQLVKKLDLAGYLLTFKDIVDFCHREGILVSIRGSAPASALLYCLGLCPIDPVEHGLLFERFASEERLKTEPPDIDLDIAHEDRERVIQYVYEKYGREHAAMVCEVNTYRPKSAVRDVGKALGLPLHQVERLASLVDTYDSTSLRELVKGISNDANGSPLRHDPNVDSHAVRARTPQGGERSEASVAPEPRILRSAQNRPCRSVGTAKDEKPRGRPHPHPLPKGEEAFQDSGERPLGTRHLALTADLLASLCSQLLGTPRHLAIHVGGMVISTPPLAEVTHIQPGRMPGRTIIPWDKDDLALLAEHFGLNLIKMDLLGLGMLALISRVFHYAKERYGHDLQLHGFQYDPRIFPMICKADTVGLFQIESRAQMSFLPQLQPKDLHDVAISVGAIRPGPGAHQAGQHIARRRAGKEPITYPHPDLVPVLEQTCGVILWQEQVMQVAMVAAGYTANEAERLRRAMTHKRSHEQMLAACQDLVDRMLQRGYTAELAEQVRKMIVDFAGYGFPRAHAYPFAHLALISATLKLHYPAAFYAALLNCQPMGFYAPHTIVWDAHRHGIQVLRVDVNESRWECGVEEGPKNPTVMLSEAKHPYPGLRTLRFAQGDNLEVLRLGFNMVRGLGPAAREALERERARGAFRSLADFVSRTGFERDSLERLAEVGAFLAFADRRAAMWESGELAGLSGPGHLNGLAELLAEQADLPPMDAWEATQADYRSLGFSPDQHLVTYFRADWQRRRIRTARELISLPGGGRVRTGGIVIIRQRPETANNYVFLTLEDETGLSNVIVRPAVYERYRQIVRGQPLIVVEGRLQQDDGVTNLLAERFWPVRGEPSAWEVLSRDFH